MKQGGFGVNPSLLSILVSERKPHFSAIIIGEKAMLSKIHELPVVENEHSIYIMTY